MNIRDVLFMRNTGKLLPRASIQDKLLARKLSGGGTKEKTIDFTPVITVSDAKAGAVIDLQSKITAVQSGTGDPSPSNIRPITGWTGAQITRAGKNLFHAQNDTKVGVTLTVLSDGGIKLQGLCTANYIFSVPSVILPTATYTMSCGLSGNLPDDTAFIAQALVGSSDASFTVTNRDAKNTSFKVSATRGGSVTFRIRVEKDYDYDCIIYPQFEVGQTATAYTPYETPTVYSVSWLSEAGTVYGGVLDATTGTLTVDRAYLDMTAFEWAATSTADGLFRVTNATFTAYKWVGQEIICNIYTQAPTRNHNNWTNYDNIIGLTNTEGTPILRIKDTALAGKTAEEVKQYITAHGGEMTILLKEPITYTLTPTEIALLAGANTLWADTGDSSMVYLAKK